MDFNKSLLLIVSLVSSLLLSCHAVPPTFDVDTPQSRVRAPSPAPAPAPSNEGVGILDPALTRICETAENISLCVNTVAAHSTGPFDPIKALQIEIDALVNQTKNNILIINKHISENKSGNKKLAEALDFCRRKYDDMLDDIKTAQEDLLKTDLSGMLTNLNYVIVWQADCEEEFSGSGIEFPFANDSLLMRHLTDSCLAIGSKISNNVIPY